MAEGDIELEKLRREKMNELMSQDGGGEKNSASAKPVHVTDDSFDETIKNNGLVLVDAWAEWCMPCRMLAPTMEELAEKYAGKLTVAKLDVDKNQKTAMRFQTMSIPTLLLFKGGELVERTVGVQPAPVLEKMVEKHM